MSLNNKFKDFGFRARSIFYGMEITNGIRRELSSTLILLYFIFLGHSIMAVTSLFAVSSIILTLFEFPTGAFADHYSRKKSIMISFLLIGTAFLGIFLFRNFWVMAFFFVLQDIGWTFQSGTTTAWIVDTLRISKSKKKLVSLFSRFMFFEKSGGLVGSLIGFAIVGINFRFVWLAIAIANYIMLMIIAKCMEEPNFKPSPIDWDIIPNTFVKAKESLKYLFHEKSTQIRGLALAAFIFIIAYGCFCIGMPLVLSQNLHLSPKSITGISFLIGIVMLASPFFGEKTAHRYGIRNSLFYSFIIISVASVGFIITNNIYIALISLAVFRFLDMATSTVHESAVQYTIPSKNRATIGSAMGVIWGVANAAGSLIAGFLMTYSGPTSVFILCAVLSLATGIVYLISLKG